MKMRPIQLACLLLISAGPLLADSPVQISRTHGNTLNDLIRELPIVSGSWEDQLRRLSAVQEQLYLHELKMRGEGLPHELETLFSANYSGILSALVEDRITEEYGRELLSIHRQLLERTRLWMTKRVRNEDFPKELAENVEFFGSELERYSIALVDVPDNLRTPVINGYQAWVGELLAWGEQFGTLASGDLNRIRVKADDLERFEGYYKRDGILQPFEREQLHGRFINLTRETIEVISR